MNSRPPIITIVGHIDHGKSSLLDYLRDKNTKRVEAGGITQHIGAYEITFETEGKKQKATVIDTPGHSAFAHIREKSLIWCDIALLVVSLEDGVKEQTKEAYATIVENKIPFIVVFTKLDKAGENLEKVKYELLENGIMLEKLGGDISYIAISSKTGENINELLDLIHLTAELNEININPNAEEVGVLIETSIDSKAGISGTIILTNGSIELGKYIVVGDTFCPIRILQNAEGENIKQAVPSMPIKLIGFDKLPPVSEKVYLFNKKLEAKEYTKNTINKIVGPSVIKTKALGGISLVLKADTQGSLEAIINYVESNNNNELNINILKKSIGKVNEDDLIFSKNPNTYIIAFHTKIENTTKKLADQGQKAIQSFDTIYEFIDWLTIVTNKFVVEKSVEKKTGEGKAIKLFQNDGTGGNYIIGIEILSGNFNLGQKIMIKRKEREVGIYTIKNIEQKNKKVDSVSDTKTQFACEIKGDTELNLNDFVIGLYFNKDE